MTNSPFLKGTLYLFIQIHFVYNTVLNSFLMKLHAFNIYNDIYLREKERPEEKRKLDREKIRSGHIVEDELKMGKGQRKIKD